MDVLPVTIPEHVLSLFWDTDKSGIDARQHARYIICRILDFGDSPQVRWMLETYGEETVRQVVASNPPLHPKPANYWRKRFGLPAPDEEYADRVAERPNV
ncbi:MAG: hypothetical protein NTX53_17550 [candidate division WOR-3 bacterium]|nr:hypothetical protein [candidate division WOR-3 bacterium]